MSSAGRMAGSFAEYIHEKGEDLKTDKEAQAVICDWKSGDWHQSCKIREEVRNETQCQGSKMCLSDGRQLESRPLKVGRVTTYLPENHTKECSCNSLYIYHPHVVGYELSSSLFSTEFEHFVLFL